MGDYIVLCTKTPTSMIICPSCGYKNRIGTFFCEDCGRSMDGNAANPTIPTRKIQSEQDDASAKATWGSAHFSNGTAIILHFRDSIEPVTLTPSQRTIFGRADSSSTVNPDFDLTPYGALEKGVSRHHAAIEFTEDTLMLMDVGSSNGTYLNGQRLVPNQPRILRDGDEVRLGKLIAHVYFK